MKFSSKSVAVEMALWVVVLAALLVFLRNDRGAALAGLIGFAAGRLPLVWAQIRRERQARPDGEPSG